MQVVDPVTSIRLALWTTGAALFRVKGPIRIWMGRGAVSPSVFRPISPFSPLLRTLPGSIVAKSIPLLTR